MTDPLRDTPGENLHEPHCYKNPDHPQHHPGCGCACPAYSGQRGAHNDPLRDTSTNMPEDGPNDPDAGIYETQAGHLLSWAWTIIANAHNGDWDKATPEWKAAAEKWREAYHDAL